jgi:hypothetical protein
VRIYTEAELLAEKPKGELLLRNNAGKLWRVFQCHGCQTCFVFAENPERVVQEYPHFIGMTEVVE